MRYRNLLREYRENRKRRVRALFVERDRLRKSASPAMPDAAVATGCADDRARISEAAIDAA